MGKKGTKKPKLDLIGEIRQRKFQVFEIAELKNIFHRILCPPAKTVLRAPVRPQWRRAKAGAPKTLKQDECQVVQPRSPRQVAALPTSPMSPAHIAAARFAAAEDFTSRRSRRSTISSSRQRANLNRQPVAVSRPPSP